MMGFEFRLVPPRPTLAQDMSPEEAATMGQHVAYWSGLAASGQALAYGPVADPAGGYGIGIVLADDQAAAELVAAGDPAVRSPHGLTMEIFPMPRLVTPTATYP